MRKLSALLLVGLLFASTAFASVGVKSKTAAGGTSQALQATDIVGTGASIYTDGSTVTIGGGLNYPSVLVSNATSGNSTVLFSSSTAFQMANLPYTLVMKAIGGASETSLLPRGTPGQVTTFVIYSDVSTNTWTLKPDTAATSPVASTGFTQIVFNYVGQTATLLYQDDTHGWSILATSSSASVALPTVTTYKEQ